MRLNSLSLRFLSPLLFFKKVKKVLQWIPVLWNDGDFDHGYLFDIIDYKLERMSKAIKEEGWSEEHLETAASIDEARRLLERMLSIQYECSPEMSDILDELDGYTVETPLDNGAVRWDTSSTPQELSDRFKKQLDIDHKRAMKARKKFFSYFRNNFDKWWD